MREELHLKVSILAISLAISFNGILKHTCSIGILKWTWSNNISQITSSTNDYKLLPPPAHAEPPAQLSWWVNSTHQVTHKLYIFFYKFLQIFTKFLQILQLFTNFYTFFFSYLVMRHCCSPGTKKKKMLKTNIFCLFVFTNILAGQQQYVEIIQKSSVPGGKKQLQKILRKITN